MKKFAKITVLSLVLASFAGLTACETMSGMGRDVQKGGEKIERSAEKNK